MAETAAITLLRPVRVLVAGHDGHVVDQLRSDLLRMGFSAMSTMRPARVADLASVERVNVVILDMSAGLAATAAAAHALDELPQRVRVLLAGRRSRAAANLGYDIVDPDGSVEELAAAVHRAYHDGAARGRRSSRT